MVAGQDIVGGIVEHLSCFRQGKALVGTVKQRHTHFILQCIDLLDECGGGQIQLLTGFLERTGQGGDEKGFQFLCDHILCPPVRFFYYNNNYSCTQILMVIWGETYLKHKKNRMVL